LGLGLGLGLGFGLGVGVRARVCVRVRVRVRVPEALLQRLHREGGAWVVERDVDGDGAIEPELLARDLVRVKARSGG